MRITRVETIRSPCRNYCWIHAHTDTGLTGGGSTYHRADPAEAVIHEFARRCLLGRDPFDIEHIWYAMYHYASYHGLMGAELRARSGIDMALWDIVAKAVELPLYKVLGGRTRDKVPIYFSGIYDECETSREALQSWSQQCVDNGWKACKTACFFGDFYPRSGCTDFGKVAGYISAADSGEGAGVPIAAGERIFSRWGFKEILELNAADILNPDLAWTGGISEVKKIAAYAEVHYVPVAPHNYGPLTCMALTHLMATLPNTRHLEFTAYHYPTWNTYIDEPIAAREGMLEVPERPGLGRKLSPAMLELERTLIAPE